MTDFPVLLDIYRVLDDDASTGPGRRVAERLSLTGPGTYAIGRLAENDICLDAPEVSRSHAFLIVEPTRITVVDRGSKNGTFIDGERITSAAWDGSAPLRIDPYEIVLVRDEARQDAPINRGDSVEIDLNPRTSIRAEEERTRQASREMAFPNSVFNADIVATEAIRASGYLLGEFEYLALGGGLGSFAWVDHLRIYGVPKQSICVLGDYDWRPNDPRDYPKPYGNYRRLCVNSQIPDHERLRSNSSSTPDNIWGFPGYASRETWRDLKKLRLSGLRHIMRVFAEPALAESYTPRSGDVFRSIDREAARIGWRDLCIACRVLALRKTNDGRYAVAIRVQEEHASGGNRDRIIIGRFVQLATGYPGYRTEHDVFDFSGRYLNEQRVFKAYDDHEAIYQALESSQRPVAVALRGRGIVASRILQRLYAARAHNKRIKIYHQMRTRIGPNGGSTYGRARRRVSHNTELQPFNCPKACWGGELRYEIERATPEERSRMMMRLGGTTTAWRSNWERIAREGLRDGWYQIVVGPLEVKKLSAEGGAGKVIMEYSGQDGNMPQEIAVDYVIDCIGLVGDISRSDFLKDLIETYHLPRNRDYTRDHPWYLGIAVTPDFEVAGLRNGRGRVFAAGQITAHGPHAAADSFLGLQYCGLRAVDHLHALGAPDIATFGAFKSFGQWLRWCASRAP